MNSAAGEWSSTLVPAVRLAALHRLPTRPGRVVCDDVAGSRPGARPPRRPATPLELVLAQARTAVAPRSSRPARRGVSTKTSTSVRAVYLAASGRSRVVRPCPGVPTSIRVWRRTCRWSSRRCRSWSQPQGRLRVSTFAGVGWQHAPLDAARQSLRRPVSLSEASVMLTYAGDLPQHHQAGSGPGPHCRVHPEAPGRADRAP